ncbi:MAG: type VII secretion protein EccB [Nocardioides sp.]
MATKRDLVEAHAFSRRRLVTAFVSGAPGGREVEPARPGRTIVGGLALAVLLVAGAAIAGVFAPRDSSDWKNPGLVVSKETGAAYVILKASDHPVLRPVINITSARLILQDDATPTLVSQDTIDQQTIGEDIGILGAPASLPTSGLLVDSGWTACTASDAGIRVDVSADPDVTAQPRSGFLVESGGTYYAVAQGSERDGRPPAAYRYLLPQVARGQVDDLDNLLGELGLPIRAAAVKVSSAWLALLPAGGDLDWSSFGVDGLGQPVSYAGDTGVPTDARVGDVVTSGSSALLLTPAGPITLDPWALAVYRHTATPLGLPTVDKRVGRAPRISEESQPATGEQKLPAYAKASWPDDVLLPHDGAPCAQLTTASGSAPTVQVVSDPGPRASADGLAAGTVERTVDAGRGAYVLSGDWSDTTQGSPFVIDAKGSSYPLVGEEAASRLGYGSHPVVVVPDSWVKLFDPGVNLSVDDALCPPHEVGAQACQ